VATRPPAAFVQHPALVLPSSQVMKRTPPLRKAVELRIAGTCWLSQLSPGDRDQYREYWRFTSDSAQRLFEAAFSQVQIKTYGNVLAAVGFLHGLAVEDLSPAELEENDPNYEVIVAVRAVK